MTSTLLTLILTGALIGATGLAQAQEIQERKENQQDRIANGVANGSLTPHETANLEHKEAGLNKEIRHDRRQNGGNLTNKEKAQVNRQQNKLSRNIYRDKHNAARQ
jgi:broad specificity phosphatase PhoE